MRSSKNQYGIVLAFCLIILLLLTLLGTRLIQQNKQQLTMANNARLSTQEFSSVEGILVDVKNSIDADVAHDNYYLPDDGYFSTESKLPINDSKHQCHPTANYKQNIKLAGAVTGVPQATILSVRCQGTDNNTEQVCSTYDGSKITCNTNTNCKTIDEAITAFQGTNNLCYQDYDPQAQSMLVKGKCPKEIYKIQVISTNVNGSSRQIISDHVVGCGS